MVDQALSNVELEKRLKLVREINILYARGDITQEKRVELMNEVAPGIGELARGGNAIDGGRRGGV